MADYPFRDKKTKFEKVGKKPRNPVEAVDGPKQSQKWFIISSDFYIFQSFNVINCICPFLQPHELNLHAKA